MRRSCAEHHSAISGLISLPPKEFFCFACGCGGGTLGFAEAAEVDSGACATTDAEAPTEAGWGPDLAVESGGAVASTEALP